MGVDTTAPETSAAVTALTDDLGIITGTLASGASTDDTSLAISGTLSEVLETGGSVRIYDGSTFLGIATVSDTTWRYTDSRMLTNSQTVSYTAQVADAAGNQSAAGTAYTATINTTAPSTTAAVTAITDDVGIFTGTIASGATTDDTSLTISGTLSAALAAGETLRVYDGSTFLGTATVSSTTWSYTDSSSLTDTQSISYTARVVNAIGNQSAAGTAYTITVDTTAPTGSIDTATDYAAASTNPFGISDVYLAARPAFADADADGDLDLFIGDNWGNTLLFKNTSAAGAKTPAYDTGTTNPFGITDVGMIGRPAFADADSDGDLDLFIGEFYGCTLFFRNTASLGASAPAYATASTNPFGISDVGGNASPAFADADADGDLDLFIGNYDGNTLFFRNNAAAGATAPAYATANTNPFGISDVGINASPAFADADADGDLDLFIGYYGSSNSGGKTVFFRNIFSSSPAAVTSITDNYGNDKGTLTSGFITDDPSLSLSGVISAGLAHGETVRVYDGTSFLGIASVAGHTWSYDDTRSPIRGKTFSYTAKVADAAGNESVAGTAYTGRFVTTADVTYIEDDVNPVGYDNTNTYHYKGKLTTATVTNDRQPSIGGTISTALGPNETLGIYDGNTYLGDAVVSGTTWYFDYRTRNLYLNNGQTANYSAKVLDRGSYYAGKTYTITCDTTDPTTTATVTSISDDFGEATGAISGPATRQITTLTFAASYDVGDVVSLVVDGVTYRHTVAIAATSAEKVYDALKLITANNVSLASSLSGKGVTWAADLTNNAVTLISTAGASKAFTLTTAVDNSQDTGVGTYRLDFPDNLTGRGTSEKAIQITLLGTVHQTTDSTTNDWNTRFDTAGSALETTLRNAGYPTTFNSANNYFDITISNATAITSTNLSGVSGFSTAAIFTSPPPSPFVGPTDQGAPTVNTTSRAADTIIYTDDVTPTLTGTISAALTDGEIVRIYAKDWTVGSNTYDKIIGQATVNNANLTWTLTPTLEPVYNTKTYKIEAWVLDKAGNYTRSAEKKFDNDQGIPTTSAVVTAITDDAGIITGTVASGATTNDTSLVASGTLSTDLLTGESVRIYDTGTFLGTATVSGTTWSYADNRTLTHDQSVSYTARVADAATNLGPTGTAYTAKVDTTPPTSTAAIDTVADDFRTSQSSIIGGTTDDRTPTFKGTNSVLLTGETVRIYNGSTLLGTATVSGTNWSFITPTALPATAGSVYSTTARVADAVGNPGTASEARTFTLNTTPTSTAAITNVADDFRISQSTVAEGDTTDDRTPTIKGTISAALAADESVRIYNNGTTLLGSATVDNTAKTWSFTPTLQATASTLYSITARIADEAGNPGPASTARTFTLNNKPTTTATISSIVDNVGTTVTVALGDITDDLTPTISGNLSAALQTGETLRIYNGTTLLGNATVTGTSWAYTPTLPATAGTNYTITARVASEDGILGTESAARTFTLDTSITKSAQSSITLNKVWKSDGPITLLSKFLGFAKDGFSLYDSKAGLPQAWSKTTDFYSDVVSGLGIGEYYYRSLRAGLDMQLNAKAGTGKLDLDLNDSIKWFWSKSGDTITLGSAYDSGSRNLNVQGPSLELVMTGLASIEAVADLRTKTPGNSWEIDNLIRLKSSSELFKQTFSFVDVDSKIGLFDDAVSIKLPRFNLATDKNVNIANGVTSTAESELIGVYMDVDRTIGMALALAAPPEAIVPSLNIDIEWNLGAGVKVGATLDILNFELGEKASLKQDISATVDTIIGTLRTENGSSLNYKVGDLITLPLSVYDANKDGVIDFDFNYTKKGSVANSTDFVLATEAIVSAGSLGLYAKLDSGIPLVPSIGINYDLPPLWQQNLPITSSSYNVYKDSWNVDLATGSNHLSIS